MELIHQIKAKANMYADEFIAVRRHLHSHPELSYVEFETSQFVQEKLKSFGIEFESIATTGVLAIIRGKIRIAASLLCVRIWMLCRSPKKMINPIVRSIMG